jgi:hypothetical protein
VFIVVAMVLLGSYFFTDAMPIWIWVLLASGSICWMVQEPIDRLLRRRQQRHSTRAASLQRTIFHRSSATLSPRD